MISSSGSDRLWTVLSLVGLCMTLSRFALPRTPVARPAVSRGPSALAAHLPRARRPVESWSLEFARRAADRWRGQFASAGQSVSGAAAPTRGAARPAPLSASVAPAGLFSDLKGLLASALGRFAAKARKSPFKGRPLAAMGAAGVASGRQGPSAGVAAPAGRLSAGSGLLAAPAAYGDPSRLTRAASRNGALAFAPVGGPAGASPFSSAAPSAVALPGVLGLPGHARTPGAATGAGGGAGFGIGGADAAPKASADEDRAAHPTTAAPRDAPRDDSAAKKTALREEAIFVRDLVAKPYAAALREALARYAEQLSGAAAAPTRGAAAPTRGAAAPTRGAAADPQIVEAASAAAALAERLDLSAPGWDAAEGLSAARQAVLLFRLRAALPAAVTEQPSPWELLPEPVRASLAGVRTPGAEARRALYELDAWIGPDHPALSSAGDGLAAALARASELERSGDGLSKSIALAQGAAGALSAVRDLGLTR